MVEVNQNARALSVLILEEREDDTQRILLELEKSGYVVQFLRVESEAGFVRALAQQKIDLILTDYYLNDFTARAVLRHLHEHNLEIPLIVVTDSLSEEYVVALMRQGASDYVIKDRLIRLGGAVAAALEQKRLRAEKNEVLLRLSDSEERLRRMADSALDVLFRLRTHPNLEFEFLSPSVERVLGYPLEYFHRDHGFIFEIVYPDDRAKLLEQFDLPRVFTDTYVLRWKHKDGHVVWTEQNNVRVFNEEGVLVAVEGIARDITERVKREQEREAILAVVSALRDAMTRAEIAPVVVEKAARLTGAERVALCTVNPYDNSLLVDAAVGNWASWIGRRLEVDSETLRSIVAEGKPVLHRTGKKNGPDRRKPVSTGWLMGLSVMICVPMISQGETMGLLCVGSDEADLSPEQQENIMKLITVVADIGASALHRASLYEDSRQRVQRLTSLRNIDRALSAGLERNVIVSILLDQLMLNKDVALADLLLLDPHTRMLRFEAGRGYQVPPSSGPGGGLMLRLNECLAGQVVLDRKIRNEADLLQVEDGGIQRALFLAEGARAYLAVPLMAHGEVLGVLELLRREPIPFEIDWLEFIESLVGQLSTALSNAALYEKIQRSNLDLVQAYDAVIQAWAQALESRSIEPLGHTRRTLQLMLAMARSFGVPNDQLPHIRRGVLLHDIGKMGIPDHILLKPGPLTPEEMSEVRRHPHLAFIWLSPIVYLHPAIDIPYCHHEWWDGGGYPRGLRGTQIPLPARIFSVVDVWDVLLSNRPYRAAWTVEQAAAYIRERAGTQFDPSVVTAFLKMIEDDAVEVDG